MATSPNYGWEEPDDTDLVKDGALSIRTLGNAIDSSVYSALGGKKSGEITLASGTFTGSSAVNLTNVLSSTYIAYKLYLVYKGSTTADLLLRARENTTDKTTGYYAGGNYGSRLGATGAAGQRDGGANFGYSGHNSTNYVSSVSSIIRASATQMLIHYQGYDDNSVVGYTVSGTVGGMTNVTGLTFYPSSGTLTGSYILTGVQS